MFLKKLSLINFKNHEELNFDFSSSANCFTGKNGVGKTNILDAIYYLSYCKSYFNPSDSQNIQHEAPFFVIQGYYEMGDKTEEIYCGLKRNHKKIFKRNQKEYERLSDHIGLFPLVIISPYDSNLISEGSEERRKFMDGVISQYDKVYLEHLINYNKLLLQRNSLLKQFAEQRFFDPDTLEVYDEQMIKIGTDIFEKRKLFLNRFTPVLQQYYKWIASSQEGVDLKYISQLHESDWRKGLDECLMKDRSVQHSTFGIHKDDLDFLINGRSVKKYGSQGQQKSFLIALKIAQFIVLKEASSRHPLLLLDDIYDKLDEDRIKNLMQLITDQLNSQLFITDTHKERVEKLFKEIKVPLKIFSLNN